MLESTEISTGKDLFHIFRLFAKGVVPIRLQGYRMKDNAGRWERSDVGLQKGA
jgi:hypothetical protein